MAGLGNHANAATHAFDGFADNRQTYARALSRVTAALEDSENAFAHGFGKFAQNSPPSEHRATETNGCL